MILYDTHINKYLDLSWEQSVILDYLNGHIALRHIRGELR